MFVLLVSFSSKPHIFVRNWTRIGERWSGLVCCWPCCWVWWWFWLGRCWADSFGRTYFFGAGGDNCLVPFFGFGFWSSDMLAGERHIQVESEPDHNNLIIISSLRSESDHHQCLIRSHFRSCSGDLKPAKEKEEEEVYVQVSNMTIDQLLITKKSLSSYS